MKALKFFSILSSLLIATLYSCSKEDTLVLEDKFYTVSLKFNGDITTVDSPLTRGTATDDLYGLMVWQDGSFFGGGLYDNLEDMKVRLQATKKYKFAVTIVKNGKNFIYKTYDGSYSYPFAYEERTGGNTYKIIRTPISNKLNAFNEKHYDFFKYGLSQMAENLERRYNPETDRYYGEIENYTPTKNGTVNIELKRTAFGLQYKVSGVSDGTFTINIKRGDETFFSKSDITADYTSDPKIITFHNVYSAWLYGDNYTEEVEISASWARGIGINQDLGTKTIIVKRNKMNIIHINLTTDESGNNLGIDLDSETMDNESVTIPFG